MLRNPTHADATAVGGGNGRLAAVLRWLGGRRQSLVIRHDVLIAALSLPIAYMLRDTPLLLDPWRQDHVLGAMPMMVLAALVATLDFAS
jgi:hypothetical protein